MRIKELMFKNKVPTKALTIDMKYPPLPTTHIILKKKRVSGLAPSLNMLKRIITHQSNQENGEFEEEKVWRLSRQRWLKDL